MYPRIREGKNERDQKSPLATSRLIAQQLSAIPPSNNPYFILDSKSSLDRSLLDFLTTIDDTAYAVLDLLNARDIVQLSLACKELTPLRLNFFKHHIQKLDAHVADHKKIISYHNEYIENGLMTGLDNYYRNFKRASKILIGLFVLACFYSDKAGATLIEENPIFPKLFLFAALIFAAQLAYGAAKYIRSKMGIANSTNIIALTESFRTSREEKEHHSTNTPTTGPTIEVLQEEDKEVKGHFTRNRRP